MEQIARSRWNVGPLAVIVLTVTWSCGGSVPEQSRADSAGVSTTARLSGAKVAVEPSLATRFCRDSIVQGNDAAEPCVGSVGRHDIARESEAKQFWQFAGLAGVFENATDTVSRCAERTKARCEALGSQSQTLAQITIRPVKDAIKIVPDHLEQRVIVARLDLAMADEFPVPRLEEQMYGILSNEVLQGGRGDTLRHVHLLTVRGTKVQEESRWEVWRITKVSRTNGTVSYRSERGPYGSNFHRCLGKAHTFDNISYADFLDCEGQREVLATFRGSHRDAQYAQAYQQVRARKSHPYYQPAWLTCGVGCCEVGF